MMPERVYSDQEELVNEEKRQKKKLAKKGREQEQTMKRLARELAERERK